MLLGESAPNLVILKFDTLSPSRKRVLSYKSAVTGKRVLSYPSAVTGKRVLSSYIGRLGLIETCIVDLEFKVCGFGPASLHTTVIC